MNDTITAAIIAALGAVLAVILSIAVEHRRGRRSVEQALTELELSARIDDSMLAEMLREQANARIRAAFRLGRGPGKLLPQIFIVVPLLVATGGSCVSGSATKPGRQVCPPGGGAPIHDTRSRYGAPSRSERAHVTVRGETRGERAGNRWRTRVRQRQKVRGTRCVAYRYPVGT